MLNSYYCRFCFFCSAFNARSHLFLLWVYSTIRIAVLCFSSVIFGLLMVGSAELSSYLASARLSFGVLVGCCRITPAYISLTGVK